MDYDEVISTLNNLIETCIDGQNGFRTAAEGVESSELIALFNTYSHQRGHFAFELQNEVRTLGGNAEETGSTAAALHRGWMTIKWTVTGEDEGAIISECERGEVSAVKAYREALQKDLPANVRERVENQCALVQDAHDRIGSLEKAKVHAP